MYLQMSYTLRVLSDRIRIWGYPVFRKGPANTSRLPYQVSIHGITPSVSSWGSFFSLTCAGICPILISSFRLKGP